MCRFLIVKSKEKINPVDFLVPLAELSEKSIAPNGDRQWDGYGIAWQNNGRWDVKKSLAPMWEEQNLFEQIPKTDMLVAHARGSGFMKDKSEIAYNQPFTDGTACFVFNGTIYKVRLAISLDGEIGSQKLFSLLKMQLKDKDPKTALEIVDRLVLRNSQKIEGMNIGFVVGRDIYVLNQYKAHEEYYGMYFYQSPELTLVCSEPFGSYDWKKFEKGEVKSF